MKITITQRPEFHFNLTAEEIRLLVSASKRQHYDAHCSGGFLSKWNEYLFDFPAGEVTASYGDLHMCLKILELYPHASHLAGPLRSAFLNALRRSNTVEGRIEPPHPFQERMNAAVEGLVREWGLLDGAGPPL